MRDTPIMSNGLTGSGLRAQWGPRTPTKTCPDGQLLWIHVDTGLPIVKPCRKNACLQCVRPKVRQVERAARFNCPNAFITLTQLDCDDEVNRNSMNLLTRYLGRDGLDLAMVWAAERSVGRSALWVRDAVRGRARAHRRRADSRRDPVLARPHVRVAPPLA